MGHLCHVSFNGIDVRTDLKRLAEIQKKYSFAEFGVILSVNWKDNGNRYWNPENLHMLEGYGLNLSAHLCGRVARRAIRDDWTPALELCLNGYFDLFKRTQLNIARCQSNPSELKFSNIPSNIQEVIIQQRSIDECNLFKTYNQRINDNRVVMLIDSSGGLGIESEIVPVVGLGKIGYAGGINPENVASKTIPLLKSEEVGNFWIDMESGVRTDDWFDLDKVEDVCKRINELLIFQIFSMPSNIFE